MKNKPVLLFDYDGTIHETLRIYEPAMRNAFCWLRENKGIVVPEVSSEKIASWLGMSSIDMWNSFMPQLSDELKAEVSSRVADEMARLTYEHKGKWYPYIKESLVNLKALDYTIIILSNCRSSYKKAHWEVFNMAAVVDDFYDCESFNYKPKEEIFLDIKKKYSGSYIVIGDRDSDLKCARVNSLPFIGCLYGYGSPDELSGADILISSPYELISAVRGLS